MIVIVDYGLGNPASIKNMIAKLGMNGYISSDPEVIKKATKIIIPGVGNFDAGMKRIISSNLVELLNELVLIKGVPVLGICLGMQMFMESSEEGSCRGLGWIKGHVIKFQKNDIGDQLKIPNMGWSEIKITKPHFLFNDIEINPRFYFVHSYYVKCSDTKDQISSSTHGHEFTCAIAQKNICGVQFHPEKSHSFGMKLLNNFITEKS